MDFNKVLSMATNNKQYSSYVTPAKRYSTELPAPKKPPKSNVQSDAVKAFLAKKQREEELKAREFDRRKQELLELRSIAKHNRKANAMAKRTKDNNFMATFSIMEELAKNGDNTNASTLPSSYRPCASDDRCSSSSVRKPGQQTDRSPPYRGAESSKYGGSQNRPKNGDFGSAHPSKRENTYRSENDVRSSAGGSSDRKGGPNRKPPPPPQSGLNFHELLKLAAKKQHEPVDIPKIKKPVAKDIDFQGRPMTNDEKRRFIEEQTRKQGRSLAEVTLPPTSRKRRKFRHDTDGDELVASNLAAPPAKSKIPSSAGQARRPANVQSQRPQNIDARERSRPQTQNLHAVPKLGTPRSGPNVSRPVQNPSASKSNREPVPRPAKPVAGVLTSNRMVNGERTKETNRLSNGERTNRSTGLSNGERTNRSTGLSNGERTKGSTGLSNGERTNRSTGLSNGERTKGSTGLSNGERTNRSTGLSNGERTKGSTGLSNGERTNRSTGFSNGERAKGSTGLSNGERTKLSTVLQNGKFATPSKLPPRRDATGNVQMRPNEVPKFRTAQSGDPPRNGPPNKAPVPGRMAPKMPPGSRLPTRDQTPKQYPPRDVQSKGIPNRDVRTKQLQPRDAPPKQLPKQFPPRDLLPKQFPPRDLMPKQFPPRDLMPRQFPPRNVQRLPQRPMKRRIESDDEYDDEMDDFIDDEPIDGENMDVSEHIREIFGYDRNKYRFEPEDDLDIMESSFAQQMREEAISTKMGILEDLEDIRREQEELRGKASKVLVGKVPKKKKK